MDFVAADDGALGFICKSNKKNIRMIQFHKAFHNTKLWGHTIFIDMMIYLHLHARMWMCWFFLNDVIAFIFQLNNQINQCVFMRDECDAFVVFFYLQHIIGLSICYESHKCNKKENKIEIESDFLLLDFMYIHRFFSLCSLFTSFAG